MFFDKFFGVASRNLAQSRPTREFKRPSRDRSQRKSDLIGTFDELKFSLATTEPDLRQAYSLLYKAYVANGIQVPNECKMRITKYNALPTTHVIVGKIRGKVVATYSVVEDGIFGLPLDSALDLRPMRAKNRIIEFSGLTIDPELRGQNLLIQLFRSAYWFVEHFIPQDYVLLGIHPKALSHYRNLLGFTPATDRPIGDYLFANNLPVQPIYARLKDISTHLRKNFWGLSKEEDLFSYFFINAKSDLNFDTNPVRMTDETFQNLFLETGALENLSDAQIQVIRSLWRGSNTHLRAS